MSNVYERLTIDAERSRLCEYKETTNAALANRSVPRYRFASANGSDGICACQFISPDSCIFSSHSTPDSSEGGSGDGCLCCCAHIVVVPPMAPLASIGFISRAAPYEELQTPEIIAIDIEHPPRS